MGELEDHSLWYKYKSKVWAEDSEQAAAIHNTMRVLRSIGNNHPLGYFSVAITSGKTMYDRMIEAGVKTPTREMIGPIIDANLADSYPRYEALKERVDMPLIYPHYLVPARQKWTQDHFQALWLSIIGELCTHHYMDDNWHTSSGGSEEFVHTQQLKLGEPTSVRDSPFYNTREHIKDELERMKNINVYDLEGNVIDIPRGIELISGSADHYRGLGFDTSRLDKCVELLDWTDRKLAEGFYQKI